MTNTNTVIGLLAETSIHSGCGRDCGAIDLPVAREATTGYPYIPGSSFKGALKDHARKQDRQQIDALFGKPDQAGGLIPSDARLLLLPVRSLTGSYRWATCPHLLERLGRDLRRSQYQVAMPAIGSIKRHTALTFGQGSIYLEERIFQITGQVNNDILILLGKLIPHQEVRERLSTQLVILADDDFAWFARYGLPVQARNVLDEKTKSSENLWYEENLPPDTLLYSLLIDRVAGSVAAASQLLAQRKYLQIGGNETVGQGWLALQSFVEEVSHA